MVWTVQGTATALLLSLKSKELAHFSRYKNEGICQQNQHIDQDKNQVQSHFSP
jgi:hypothetical protein